MTLDDNKIFIENFEYQSESNILKSVGKNSNPRQEEILIIFSNLY